MLLRRRLPAVAVGLLARLGWPRAFAVWPAIERPLFLVELATTAPAAWLRRTFERRFAERRGLGGRVSAATWSAMRARGLLVAQAGGFVIEAAETGLGRTLRGPRLAAYSPSGAPTAKKANVFVFEAGSSEPTALVVAMPLVEDDPWLGRELDAVEQARSRLAGDQAVSALPPAPVWRGELRGRFAAVLPVDPIAARTGVEDRALALGWLRSFQAATAVAERPWVAADSRDELRVVDEAWSTLLPDSRAPARAIAAAALEPLVGRVHRRCAVHGDFWRGNLAASEEGRLRVYDWEWWRVSGHAAFDLWTYELAELRGVASRDRADLDGPLEAALQRVEAEAREGDLTPGLAAALLMPVVAELAIRNRRGSGRPSPPEIPYSRVMAAAERLLARRF